jgi:uncharacterized membrane protein
MSIAGMLQAPGEPVVVGKAYNPGVQTARLHFAVELKAHFGEALFSKNRGSLIAGIALAIGTTAIMNVLAAPLVFFFAIAGAMVLLLLFFAKILPAYSVDGRKLQDHIEGLRQYLSVAEADELRRMQAPPQTPEEFAKMLPYAVALGVEKTWADRFTTLLGVSAVTAAAGDYYVSDRGFSEAGGGFSSSMASLGDTISAASSPPGSTSGSSSDSSSRSSGSSGGGSSGGGGGGGGGSGW